MRETLGRFVIVVGFFIILYWYALWGILDEMTEVLNEEYGYKKLHVYGALLVSVIAFILIYPPFLQHMC
jgi:hypothetical protein